MSSNDSDSDDDLGLFSFANKKAIVSTPPASPTKSENDESPIVTDRSLFMRNNKRKRLEAPLILEETVDQTVENENDTSLTSIIEDSNAISEKIRHYDNIVASIWWVLADPLKFINRDAQMMYCSFMLFVWELMSVNKAVYYK